MKEFIQKNGDEIAIVVYDAPLPPKYFKITKSFIKKLFIVVPLVLVLFFTVLFAWGLGIRLKETPAPSLSTAPNETSSKMINLEAEVRALKESNQEMANKLADQASSVTTSEDPFLMLIKKPYGMQNLLQENRILLDQIEVSQNENRVNLNFSVNSANPQKKVTGHILVFMISNGGILVYPKDANSNVPSGIKYSDGELFAVSKFRPTKAEFDFKSSGETVKFVIYIFSKEGDLLLLKITESFKIGVKS